MWRALLPTSSMTVAFAAVVALEHDVWGTEFRDLVFATVAFFEVVAPIVLRAALDDAREIGAASMGGLVVVSNREPWAHEFGPDGSIVVRHTPGGVSVALDALMRERGGVWVAHGAGSADRSVVDERSSVEVPPDAPAYRLRRVWLSQQEVDGYYAGFANSALWPLCHQAHVRPQFRAEDWDTYQAVNRKFADIVAVEAPPDSSVFLNDYHLALVAQTLRERRPQLRTALFWHIPWPDVDRLRICPWRKELLEGLLSNDLVAFQLQRDQRNFLAAAEAELGVASRGDQAFFGDRQVRVINVPIGADFDRISTILQDPELAGSHADAGAGARPGRQGGRHRCRSSGLHEGHSRAHARDRAGAGAHARHRTDVRRSSRLACRRVRKCRHTRRSPLRSIARCSASTRDSVRALMTDR